MLRTWTAAGGATVALAMVSALACQWSPDPGGARFRCDGPTDCPAGLACIDGYCEADGDASTNQERDDAAMAADADLLDGDPVTWQEYAIGKREATVFDSVVTSTELEGDPGDFYLAFVSTKPWRTGGSASGLELEWTRVRDQCSGRSSAGIAMFWARTIEHTRGKVTVSFSGGGALGSAQLSVHRWSGASTGTPIGSVSWANSNGSDGDDISSCLGGEDTASYSWSTLDTSARRSVVVSGVHTTRYTTHEPGDGYTEISDDQSGDLSGSAGVAVQQRQFADVTSGLTVSGGWGEDKPDWAVLAAEIRD